MDTKNSLTVSIGNHMYSNSDTNKFLKKQFEQLLQGKIQHIYTKQIIVGVPCGKRSK